MRELIGNTPMIKITYQYQGVIRRVYTKLEYYNLTGSIKDRMVQYILNKAKKNGTLKEAMPIIEATSGNTGISLAALGAYYHHPVYIFMPDWVSKERISLMKLYGAQVHLISKEEGGFKRSIVEADKLSEELGGFRPNQFSNTFNVEAHYETTGKEILEQIGKSDVLGFISGIGTGGTLMGISKRLKEVNPDFMIAALEPAQLPILSGGDICSSHRIEGIGDDFIPEILNRDALDFIFKIDDGDALAMSYKLAKELGLGVGISSGANFLGAVLLADKIQHDVVTVFPDDNKKYLSTDLLENVKSNFVDDIILLGYEIV